MKTVEDALKYADDVLCRAFEKWLDEERPSGDCESVQRQWDESSVHDELVDDLQPVLLLTWEVRRLQKEVEKAYAFDWLMEKLQRAYDGEEQAFEGLFIYCRMVFGRKDHRSCSAEINFDDVRDEPIGLAAAISRAIQEEKNRVPST